MQQCRMAEKHPAQRTTPLVYRLVQIYFQTFAEWMPGISARIGLYFWGKTSRPVWRDWELELLNEASSQRIKIGRHTVAVHQWGNTTNPKILLVHGWNSRASHFRNYIHALLDKGFCVIGFDAIGHGHSTGHWTNALQYLQILKQLNTDLGPFHTAIGHSFGGFVIPLAIRGGLQCQKAVILAAPDSLSWLFDRYVNMVNMKSRTRSALQKRVSRMLDTDRWETYSIEHNAALLRGIPALILIDEDDPAVEVETARRYQHHWPGSELIITQRLGHQKVLRHSDAIQPVLKFIGDPEYSGVSI